MGELRACKEPRGTRNKIDAIVLQCRLDLIVGFGNCHCWRGALVCLGRLLDCTHRYALDRGEVHDFVQQGADCTVTRTCDANALPGSHKVHDGAGACERLTGTWRTLNWQIGILEERDNASGGI